MNKTNKFKRVKVNEKGWVRTKKDILDYCFFRKHYAWSRSDFEIFLLSQNCWNNKICYECFERHQMDKGEIEYE